MMLLELLGRSSSALYKSIQLPFPLSIPVTWTFYRLPTGKRLHFILLSHSPSFFGNNHIKNIILERGNKKVKLEAHPHTIFHIKDLGAVQKR